MMQYGKSSQSMVKPLMLALAVAAVSGLSVFLVMKWNQGPAEQAPSVASDIPASQAPSQQQIAPIPVAKPTDLETLVAPIALYPDPLLAQLLPASTYPLEVVQASRWLQSNPNAAEPTGQDWAPSVVVLLKFPQVITMMNDKLEWTTQLGDRFLAEPDSVLGAIQSLRARAMTAGLLQDMPEQKITKAVVTKVSTRDQTTQGVWVEAPAGQSSLPTKQAEVIRIEPANPQVVYVPQYNPQVLYSSAPPAQTYSTTTTTTSQSQTSPWLTFGTGVVTGALLGWAISEWSNDDWDDHYHGYYSHPPISHYSGYYGGYGGNNVNIDRNINISGNEINLNRQNLVNNRPAATPWTHDPQHRRGYRYTPEAQQRLAASQPKQQPALAGQRKASGQAANTDYTGYNRDQLDRLRQAQVEKTLGQGTASTRDTKDRAAQQKVSQSLDRTNQKPRASQQQPARQGSPKSALSGAQRNKPATLESRRRPAVQPTQRQPTAKPKESVRTQPAKSFAQNTQRGSFSGRDTATRGAFGGVNEGRRAQTYSQRGQSSRAQATGRASGAGRTGGVRRR